MTYLIRFGNRPIGGSPDVGDDANWSQVRTEVANRVAAIIQNDNLCLLLGSGYTHAIASAAGVQATGLGLTEIPMDLPFADRISSHAEEAARTSGRGAPNLEDQLNTAMSLAAGLRIYDASAAERWEDWISSALDGLGRAILETERAVKEHDNAIRLASTLLSTFAARPPTRERLHIFTTNYDRMVELSADLAGLRLLDRFVGSIQPTLRNSRANLDYIWNPPGLRGEPRFVEGVARLTKLHGSIDWQDLNREIVRIPLEFGDTSSQPVLGRRMMIYPNAAKDRALREYPYAELFRDFATAAVRSQTAIVTFGYGFGDSHVNAILADSLRLPSTLLLVISFDDPGGRIAKFTADAGASAQITTLVGPEFGDLNKVVKDYLPLSPDDTVALRIRSRRSAVAPEPSATTEVGQTEERRGDHS